MIKRPLYPAPALRNISEIKEAGVARSFEETIRGLYSILVGPASKPQEVKHAKKRMLKVLEQRRRMPFPGTLVPPLSAPPRKQKGKRQIAFGRDRRIRVPNSSPVFGEPAANRRHQVSHDR
jgi:hypothetical protein